MNTSRRPTKRQNQLALKTTSRERVEAAVAHLEEVRRQVQTGKFSRQPRFGSDKGNDLFSSIYYWTMAAEDAEPVYQADSRDRDAWLAEYWKQEPHLAGVINSVVNIDKNRAWAITGGRNQVNRYNRILREAEDGQGWRYYVAQQAQNYYTTDIGAITELGREGVGGPVRALYTLDSVLCRMTGKVDGPLFYDNTKQPWTRDDFFRVVSLPSSREEMNGLGWCAVSRILEMAKIMIAVYQHDHEMLGSRSPKGLLLLKGISESQWDTAMQARTAVLTQREQEYYGGVSVLASASDDIDAKLVALSQLPMGFDMSKATNLLMYCYSLAFGYDAREFWPTTEGSLGSGNETEVQHQKATGKGGADFMLSFQDRIQMALPDTVLFEFEQRDTQGMVLEASVIQAWADVANALYQGGMGILTRDQAASLLVANGIIPAEWTENEEDTVATDSHDVPDEGDGEDAGAGAEDAPTAGTTQASRLRHLRAKALEDERVQRAVVEYPDEPIVRVQWPTGKTTVLWQEGRQALARAKWFVVPRTLPALEQPLYRASTSDTMLLDDGDITITDDEVDAAIDVARERVSDEFGDLLMARTLTDAELNALNGA